MKRFASMLTLLVMLATILAACGGAAPAASPAADAGDTASPAASVAAPPSEEASPSVAAESPEASESPEAEESEAASPSAAAEEETPETDDTATAQLELPDVSGLDLGTITIGSQSPLSGPQAQFGGNARNGAELAIQQLGEQMGFEDLQFRPEDDQADPTTGAARANDLATDENVMCVVGHVNSGVALAALPTYQDANLVMVSPANTNPRITDEFDDTAWRLVGRDDVQGVVAANFAQESGAQSVYVLHDQTPYGEGLATVFRDTAEELGLTVTGFAGTSETNVFDSVITPIQAANPDLLFYGAIYSTAGPLIQQMRDRGLETRVLGGDGFDSSDLAQLAGEAAVGVNYVSVSGPASSYPQAAQFAEDYQAAYNAAAAYPAFQAYDAATACLLAIGNAAVEAGGRPTREQVKAAMQDVTQFAGVTGDVSFDDKGDRSPATYYIFEVGSGDPAEWGNNEVVSEIEQEPPSE
jgi:branched-chain amino acid transport system substrate-binding protein